MNLVDILEVVSERNYDSGQLRHFRYEFLDDLSIVEHVPARDGRVESAVVQLYHIDAVGDMRMAEGKDLNIAKMTCQVIVLILIP